MCVELLTLCHTIKPLHCKHLFFYVFTSSITIIFRKCHYSPCKKTCSSKWLTFELRSGFEYKGSQNGRIIVLAWDNCSLHGISVPYMYIRVWHING